MENRYSTAIQSMTADTYVTRLKTCGWLQTIPTNEHGEFIERVRTAFNKNCLYTYLELATFCFDSAECIYESGPREGSYYGIINLFSKHSNGLFRPTDVKDDMVENSHSFLNPYNHHVSFLHSGTLCKQVVEPYESFDQRIWDLIHQSLEDSRVEERFIELPVVDQASYVVFILPQIYKQAQRLDLIPPPKSYGDPETNEAYLRNYYSELHQAE